MTLSPSSSAWPSIGTSHKLLLPCWYSFLSSLYERIIMGIKKTCFCDALKVERLCARSVRTVPTVAAPPAQNSLWTFIFLNKHVLGCWYILKRSAGQIRHSSFFPPSRQTGLSSPSSHSGGRPELLWTSRRGRRWRHGARWARHCSNSRDRADVFRCGPYHWLWDCGLL